MVYEKLRNYDAAKRKHGTDLAAPPADLSNLPIWHSTCAAAAGQAQDNSTEIQEAAVEDGLDFDWPESSDVHGCNEKNLSSRLAWGDPGAGRGTAGVYGSVRVHSLKPRPGSASEN